MQVDVGTRTRRCSRRRGPKARPLAVRDDGVSERIVACIRAGMSAPRLGFPGKTQGRQR